MPPRRAKMKRDTELETTRARVTIQETLAQYLALCILALASSSRFGRYHLSSVDHDTLGLRPSSSFSL